MGTILSGQRWQQRYWCLGGINIHVWVAVSFPKWFCDTTFVMDLAAQPALFSPLL